MTLFSQLMVENRGRLIQFGKNAVTSSTGQSLLKFSADSRLTIASNTLHVISREGNDWRVFRLSGDSDVFFLVQEIPAFEVDFPSIRLLETDSEEAPQAHLSDEREKDRNLVETSRRKEHERIGAFMVSGETFYAEYKRQLFQMAAR